MMNNLTINQEGIGRLDFTLQVPDNFSKLIIPTAIPVMMEGEGFQALFQCLPGNGFSVWHSRYWMQADTVLMATDATPALELRIALRNRIRGQLETIPRAELPPSYYQFNFIPFIATRALFDAGAEYETFDIHFELSFLEELGMDYRTFQQFIEQVLKDQPAVLVPEPRRCPPMMMEAVQMLLNNSYSSAGKARLLRTLVENILLAALEDVDRTETILPELSVAHVEALHEVKRLIEASLPHYPGNKTLCKKTYLNLFILNFGFKRLFGVNPYRYYNQLRMEKGKELLRRGDSVNAVAWELNFETPRAFGKAFKALFGMTPREFRGR